jgi:AcrR family transcriptional regulator
MPRNDRKQTQRDRLLAGMVSVANRDGYAQTNVSAVIAQAGVSRPTFYDYFSDKEDCFLAALEKTQTRVLELITARLGTETPARAMQAAIEAIIAFAATDPGPARFLISEAMAGGPRSLRARDDGIARIEELIADTVARAGSDEEVADVCPPVIIGDLLI